jgi:hypothetical protein
MCWKIDNRMDQNEQQTKHTDYYSNTLQTRKSLLRYAFTLQQIAEVWMWPNMYVL